MIYVLGGSDASNSDRLGRGLLEEALVRGPSLGRRLNCSFGHNTVGRDCNTAFIPLCLANEGVPFLRRQRHDKRGQTRHNKVFC